MRNLPAAFVVIAIVLSGCSGGSDDSSPTVTTSSMSTTTGPPPPPPVVLTNTLHLYAAPLISARPPTGTEPALSDVSAPSGPLGGQEGGAQWTFTFQGVGSLSGEAHIYVRILQQLVNFGVAPPTLCTWTLTVNVTSDGADPGVAVCLSDPPGLIAAGDRELVFSISPSAALAIKPGTQLRVTLIRAASDFTTTETSVYALSGTPEFDSRIAIDDLKEPVPPV